MSLKSGIFPDKLKIARVIPLFKAADPINISNYRPISVLPSFSKNFGANYVKQFVLISDNKKFYTLKSLVFK